MKREFSSGSGRFKVSSEDFFLDDIAEADEVDIETCSSRPRPFWLSGNMIPIADRISFVGCSIPPSNEDDSLVFVDMENFLVYYPFAYDFGPVNLGSIHHFVVHLNTVLERHPDQWIVLRCAPDMQVVTNAVMMIGAYLIVEGISEPDNVFSEELNEETRNLLPYHDATYLPTSFTISVEDVWAGLAKAMKQGWFSVGGSEHEGFDCEEYDHYDDPCNGDLHRIIPDKLIAFKGPVDHMHNRDWFDENYVRMFHPRFFVDVFKEMDVKCVIRLNGPKYDKETFEENGIKVVDIFLEDNAVPSTHILHRFLQAVELADGLVAVHCDNGLGRTGTMIAAYLIAFRGFTAREAIGWMRLARPGSVIGVQQEFLVEREFALQRAGFVMKSRSSKFILDAGLDGDLKVLSSVHPLSSLDHEPEGTGNERKIPGISEVNQPPS
ncbi:hypothetical protein GUITHDRAFT_122332 [Guillardia theta CCMP2712]|uniref:protein-tyrosine-phosphatase n=1 Tax=Guillardia theta (strain CCMP2712) TaxID=905079 RepID=L1I5D9_GUITC|nr:hypothetical protein GUITHDRAFT_122332 [Guillardia theta CCMP2712]EKX31483.1 hypothetical protein GUITHDRAFT_122332 [Guillardia theta CCMP2712]|eukprot:XP_005818463.1 hypothetical protein GUITHDRAFT_122332 [Guillardia theta CCMP2712]